MKSEYKIRRIQRPLTPTTKFFDLSDKECDEEATEEKIHKYLGESHTLMNYPYAEVPPSPKKNEVGDGQGPKHTVLESGEGQSGRNECRRRRGGCTANYTECSDCKRRTRDK